MKALEKKIRGKSALITIIGLGYVGLPLAGLLAKSGYRVLGADIKEEIVQEINRGRSPINEPGLNRLLKEVRRAKRLRATTETEKAAEKGDVIFVVVQTPIDKDRRPDLQAFRAAWRTVAKTRPRGKLLIGESTVPPGAMRSIVVRMLAEEGLEAGRDYLLAYSPERAIPTRALAEMQANERIVGGVNERSAEMAAALYSQICRSRIWKTDLETAEIVKLVENTYRDVNIAFSNEIALLCEKLGVDVSTALELANRHPRVNILKPGPGVGGHCIPKDPHLLLDSARKAGLELKLISAAREVNESMPEHVVELIKRGLKEIDKTPEEARISIMGIAYKGNTDDARNSPAELIVKSLMSRSSNLISHDPYVTQDFGARFTRDIEEAVKGADCLVFLADHDVYRDLDPRMMKEKLGKPCVVVDTRRIFNPRLFEEERIRYIGLGR